MYNELPPPPSPPLRRAAAEASDYSRRPYVPPRSGWAIVGIVLAVVLTVVGLAVLAAFVLLAIGLSHYGSNK